MFDYLCKLEEWANLNLAVASLRAGGGNLQGLVHVGCVNQPEATHVFVVVVNWAWREPAEVIAIVNQRCGARGVYAAREDPVAVRLQAVVECIDGCDFVGACRAALVIYDCDEKAQSSPRLMRSRHSLAFRLWLNIYFCGVPRPILDAMSSQEVRRFLRSRSAVAGLALALAMTGCSTSGSATTDHSTHQSESKLAVQEMSADDIMFAQMMIPHHQQAVDMGVLAETRAGSDKVRELAAEIKDAQAPQIELMKAWLEAAGASLDMGHSMQMPGLLTSSQMANLEAANGDQFDKLYLLSMVEHHKGAIEMAQAVLDSKNTLVKDLAEQIVADQTHEISHIDELLGNN